jgi:hypothetical protein
MSGHEARINDALKQLGEEFRLGMIKPEEYRGRRKALLDSWGERDATTSPGSLRKTTPGVAPLRKPTSALAAPAAGGGNKALTVALVIAVLLGLAIGAYFFLRSAPPAAGTAASAAPLPSPQVVAVQKAADDFLARNEWEAGPIQAFLDQWSGLPASDRVRAGAEPSLRTLRYQLDQNIQAELQLVAPDAPPEQRERLQRLQQFARALAEPAS